MYIEIIYKNREDAPAKFLLSLPPKQHAFQFSKNLERILKGESIKWTPESPTFIYDPKLVKANVLIERTNTPNLARYVCYILKNPSWGSIATNLRHLSFGHVIPNYQEIETDWELLQKHVTHTKRKRKSFNEKETMIPVIPEELPKRVCQEFCVNSLQRSPLGGRRVKAYVDRLDPGRTQIVGAAFDQFWIHPVHLRVVSIVTS